MTAKIRLSATSEEGSNWVTFFKALESANVIKLLEVSDNYLNRGSSEYQRVYLEAELNNSWRSEELLSDEGHICIDNSSCDQLPPWRGNSDHKLPEC